MIDRRNMLRFEIELPTRITWRERHTREKQMELTTSNICAGGAYFVTGTPLAVATPVALDMLLPFKSEHKGRHRSLIVNGKVIYKDEQGMAIAFDRKYQFLRESEDQHR